MNKYKRDVNINPYEWFIEEATKTKKQMKAANSSILFIILPIIFSILAPFGV
jgi:hypothetical protein